MGMKTLLLEYDSTVNGGGGGLDWFEIGILLLILHL